MCIFLGMSCRDDIEKLRTQRRYIMYSTFLISVFQMWVAFESACEQYISECEKDPKLSIDNLYSYLDGRVDRMSKVKRQMELERLKMVLE